MDLLWKLTICIVDTERLRPSFGDLENEYKPFYLVETYPEPSNVNLLFLSSATGVVCSLFDLYIEESKGELKESVSFHDVMSSHGFI